MDLTQYQALVQNYILMIKQSRGKDPKACLTVCNELEAYGEKIADDALIGFARFSRGETYYLLNDMKNFYHEMLSCIPPMENIGEWGYIVMANNMLGIMSLNRGNAPFAMDYYIKALAICETYKLPDLEWIVHMNIGALYLNIEEYQKALTHIELAHKYISSNKTMHNYYENLTNVYIGMGKAYLCMDNITRAADFLEKIDNECKDSIDDLDVLVVECFRARIYNEQGEFDKRNACIQRIKAMIGTNVPIMDFFDDIYEYLLMLLKIEYYDELFAVLDIIGELTKKTAVKNLELKLLSIKIRYYRTMNKRADYMQATALYYELSEYLERENHAMVTSMIDLRQNFRDLSNITRRVEMENRSLHEKSETDALTGLANRYRLNTYGNEIFEKAVKTGASFAIEILDIDYFKQFNDNYGHQAGDYCIKEVARLIAMQEDGDKVFCCRYGGDEFVIIYTDYTFEEVEVKAKELKDRIVKRALEHKYSLASNIVTISQGLCWDKPKSGDSLAEYLHTADNMLYQVKEVSRNSFKVGTLDRGE